MGRRSHILQYIIILTVVIASASSTIPAKAQISQAANRANWILLLSNSVNWPGSDRIDEYSVGIYGTGLEYNELIKLKEKNNKIHDKPFSVHQFRRLRDIQPTHVLFIDTTYNSDVVTISNRFKSDSTLIIICDTSRSKILESAAIINLTLKGLGKQFHANSQRAEMVGIEITEKALSLGGSTNDLINLVGNKDKELQDQENLLMLRERDLEQKENDIAEQKKQYDNESKKVEENRALLESRMNQIEKQKRDADSLTEYAAQLKGQIANNAIKIQQQNEQIENKGKELEMAREELKAKRDSTEIQKTQLADQEKQLKKQEDAISDQDRLILFGSIFAGVIFLLVILALISSISRKKKNRQLAQLNDEVDRQKDHILTQSEQLKQINKELEKLSIVASQTDNGVVIMDDMGNIEWVNKGFSNMYGFTINDLKSNSTDSLTGFYASNTDILSIKDECLNTSQPRVFECEIVTKQGKIIWVQSTLTPILDENNKISRLVTIDTDITQIKEQEQAIMKQGQTLAMQRDELAMQNEFISEQNAHINTSLSYAKTIQDIVMPLEVNITKYFRYFAVFMPLQIVSGDFYWFTRVPDDERLAFAAAVDCTGHGVPGAFMCMISTRLLSEIIVEHKILDTDKILENLNTGLIAALKQEETDNNDSLEICICKFCKTADNDYEMSFSGAKRPLYVYHEDTKELDTLKGDRKTIGGLMSRRNALEFTSETMTLHSGDKIYMTTDGLIQQFDSKNKKYGSDRFVSLLKEISPKELPEQKTIIEQEYENFRGECEQNDDITVFAVQLL